MTDKKDDGKAGKSNVVKLVPKTEETVQHAVQKVYKDWNDTVARVHLQSDVRWLYYTNLLRSGFDEEQALILCKEQAAGL